jgi:hypothetical protein
LFEALHPGPDGALVIAGGLLCQAKLGLPQDGPSIAGEKLRRSFHLKIWMRERLWISSRTNREWPQHSFRIANNPGVVQLRKHYAVRQE